MINKFGDTGFARISIRVSSQNPIFEKKENKI